MQHQCYGGLIPRRAEPLDSPEQAMLLAVVQPTGAATDFPDGRGDTEPVAAAEETHIDRPVQKTLEGSQFAVNRTGFEILGDQPAFVGSEVRRGEPAG